MKTYYQITLVSYSPGEWELVQLRAVKAEILPDFTVWDSYIQVAFDKHSDAVKMANYYINKGWLEECK